MLGKESKGNRWRKIIIISAVASALILACHASARMVQSYIAESVAEGITESLSAALEAAGDTDEAGSTGSENGISGDAEESNMPAQDNTASDTPADENLEEEIRAVIEPYISQQTVSDLMPYVERGDAEAVLEYAENNMSDEDFTTLMEILSGYLEAE